MDIGSYGFRVYFLDLRNFQIVRQFSYFSRIRFPIVDVDVDVEDEAGSSFQRGVKNKDVDGDAAEK